MNLRRTAIVLLLVVPITAAGQKLQEPESADFSLKQALHFADLYNWADAGPLFAEAEQLYRARNDTRNALLAHIGRLRANMENRALPDTSDELGRELDFNPLLQSDDELRFFCLRVRGDIDGELDAAPMRRDWEAALKIARSRGDAKWENRASGEIGFSLFLEGDMTGARQKVGAALIMAMMSQDTGAQIRFLGAIGHALVLVGAYDDALSYFEKALKVATANPDTGYPFVINEGRLQALRDTGKFPAAQQLADEIIAEARTKKKFVKEVQALITSSTIASARGDNALAINILGEAIEKAQRGGFKRLLADAQFDLVDVYRKTGNLADAERLASAAAESTQGGGDLYLLPRRLQTLANLQRARGKYVEADATFDKAADFVDAMVGNIRYPAAKMSLITVMSDIYADQFSLAANELSDFEKAYAVVEHVRGRATTDLLMSGRTKEPAEEHEIENEISRLNLTLANATSPVRIREIRDQIFAVEQKRWVTPVASTWRMRPWQMVDINRVRNSLGPHEAILEYVLAAPRSYCLVVSPGSSRIITLPSRIVIEKAVSAYLTKLKAKGISRAEAAELYANLLAGIPRLSDKQHLIIVPDGALHLLPFDALVDTAGQYVVHSHNVTYAPSATAFYLLKKLQQTPSQRRGVLAIGGIPYAEATDLINVARARGYVKDSLGDLPGSNAEILAAEEFMRSENNTELSGMTATELAFKRSELSRYTIIHLAVHGIANEQDPRRAALMLLGDPKGGEDGMLEADEILHLQTNADLVVLSACDTAVGRLQGQEGVANLARAFLLSGAKTVVSTLWSVDDVAALYLVRRFYAHLGTGISSGEALTLAKRDIIHRYGEQASPYYWAGFKLDGVGGRILGRKLAKNPLTEDHGNVTGSR
jgi:CHAT domain-containing protein